MGQSPTVLGDINNDGIVDIRDYGIWRQQFGATDCGNPADLNGDCIVDIRDYGIWRQHFGEGTPPDRRASAPLPARMAPAPRRNVRRARCRRKTGFMTLLRLPSACGREGSAQSP